MKPYAGKRRAGLKGISGCRRSCKSLHRTRCLRVDKRTARQEAKREISLSEE